MAGEQQPGSAELSEVWLRMMSLFFARRDQFFATLQKLSLTPPHGHALISLRHGPVRMRDMAEMMACDASYVTAVADRLHELGLAERRNAADDRRVRELALTPKGVRVAQQLDEVFTAPPDALFELPVTDRDALLRIMRKLGEPADGDWMPSRSLR